MTTPTVIFDANQTLFGLDPVRDRALEAGLEAASFETWFTRVLRDGFALAATGSCAAFPDVAAHHLREALRAAGREHGEQAVKRIIGGFEEVALHPDVGPAVRALAEHRARLAVLTNGTDAIAAGALERAGLRDAFEAVLDVRAAGRWKPDAAAYRFALDQLGADAETTTMVAVHPWDVHGARQAGLRAVWVARDSQRRYPAHFAPPSARVASLTELVDALNVR